MRKESTWTITAGCGIILCITHAPFVFAQTELTLYGTIDSGVEYATNVPTAGSGSTTTASGSVARLVSGALAATRWGFRVWDFLSDDLSAVFVLENGYSTDTGTAQQGGRLFGRMAYVGLDGKLGAITLGRQKNIVYDLFVQYDPMVYRTYGLSAQDPGGFLGRADNSVKYAKSINGFLFSLLYSFGYDGTVPNGGEVAGNSTVGREYGSGINYSGGPVSLAFAYDRQQGTSVVTANNNAERFAFGARYSAGKTELFAGFRKYSNHTTASNRGENLYWIGFERPITPALKLNAGLYYTDVTGSDQSAIMLATAFTYSFSQRTAVYLNAAYVKNKGGANLGVTGPGTVIPGANQTSVVAGVRHNF